MRFVSDHRRRVLREICQPSFPRQLKRCVLLAKMYAAPLRRSFRTRRSGWAKAPIQSSERHNGATSVSSEHCLTSAAFSGDATVGAQRTSRVYVIHNWQCDVARHRSQGSLGAWWVVHNCIAHPLLGLRVAKPTVWFHDWTSMRLNKRDHLRPSPMPEVSRGDLWAWHNIAGHLAIGLVPCPATFAFHDRTSSSMNVRHWV